MPAIRRTVLACALASGVALGACGGDGGGDDDGGGKGRTGGTVKLGMSAFPDSLDPAVAYTAESWSLVWTAYVPLLTYRRAEGAAGATVVPGLAERLPEVSADRRTYRLRLRPGLRYSDGTPVRASDFEHAVKRVLRLNPAGAGYFLGIEGAEAYAEAGKDRGDVGGIDADDRTRDITITLVKPDGRLPNILAMTFAAPVPATTPFEDRTASPPPGVGQFRLTGVERGRGLRMSRVPGFRLGDIPAAKVDRIDVSVVKNRRRLTQEVQRNRLDLTLDPPAPDQVREIRRRFDGERYREFDTPTTYFFSLNEETAPFDDERVRQAAAIATDQDAVARLYGGLFDPSCNFLPPSTPGHREIEPCPSGDPEARPDLAKARALVKAAGAEGAEVTVYGSDQPEPKASAEYFADALTQIGLKARPRIIEDSQYIDTITNRKLKVQSAIASWQGDFPHPSVYFPFVDVDGIADGLNIGYVDDPVINQTLDRADAAELDTVVDQYANVDERVAQRAHVVALGNRKLTLFASERMSFADECTVVHPVFLGDLTSVCLE